MAIINGIEYGDLIFSERLKLDQKAYSNYYNDNYTDREIEYDGLIYIDDPNVLSFNMWLGTESHKKYVSVLMRKLKLKKIKLIFNRLYCFIF